MSGIAASKEAIDAFNHMKMRKKPVYNWCCWKFNDKCDQVVPFINGAGNHSDLIKMVQASCMDTAVYIAYDFQIQAGRSKIILIIWAPQGAPVKQKMLASTSAQAITKSVSGIHKNVMCDSIEDLSEERIRRVVG